MIDKSTNKNLLIEDDGIINIYWKKRPLICESPPWWALKELIERERGLLYSCRLIVSALSICYANYLISVFCCFCYRFVLCYLISQLKPTSFGIWPQYDLQSGHLTSFTFVCKWISDQHRQVFHLGNVAWACPSPIGSDNSNMGWFQSYEVRSPSLIVF